jgi:hypothetical protein
MTHHQAAAKHLGHVEMKQQNGKNAALSTRNSKSHPHPKQKNSSTDFHMFLLNNLSQCRDTLFSLRQGQANCLYLGQYQQKLLDKYLSGRD